MKKIIIFLLLIVGMLVFCNENSEKEKHTILTQFVEFQNAIKAEDMDSLNKMIKYPLFDFNFIDGVSYENPKISLSQKEVMENKERFLRELEEILLLKVNLKDNTVKPYVKEYFTISANFVTEEKIFEVFIRYNESEFSGYTVYIFYTGDNELKLMSRNFGH